MVSDSDRAIRIAPAQSIDRHHHEHSSRSRHNSDRNRDRDRSRDRDRRRDRDRSHHHDRSRDRDRDRDRDRAQRHHHEDRHSQPVEAPAPAQPKPESAPAAPSTDSSNTTLLSAATIAALEAAKNLSKSSRCCHGRVLGSRIDHEAARVTLQQLAADEEDLLPHAQHRNRLRVHFQQSLPH